MLAITEWELQRILLDLHDGPVQHMYAALSQLDLLERRSSGHRAPTPRCCCADRIRTQPEDGLAEVRSFIAPRARRVRAPTAPSAAG
jgi:hypothetical protein